VLNKIKKQNKGFTIIEVMIVLAIAGLILLIVFLAVPALQRQSRNTQIKNDAGTISGAISTFESNNNGSLPTNISGTGTVTLSAGAATDSAKVSPTTAVQVVTSVPAPATTAPALSTIDVFLGHTCNGNVSPRATCVFYSTETGSGQQQQSIES